MSKIATVDGCLGNFSLFLVYHQCIPWGRRCFWPRGFLKGRVILGPDRAYNLRLGKRCFGYFTSKLFFNLVIANEFLRISEIPKVDSCLGTFSLFLVYHQCIPWGRRCFWPREFLKGRVILGPDRAYNVRLGKRRIGASAT